MPSIASRWATWEKRGRPISWPPTYANPGGGQTLGVPFLTSVYGSTSRLIIEWAPGTDLTTASNTWIWQDISTDVMQNGGAGVTISPMGRSDEYSQAQPAGCTFRLKNFTGKYSKGPQSPNYPNVKRNVPIRVRVDLGSGPVVRFQGYATSFKPTIDATGNYSVVDVIANGVTRRLSQGTAPVESPLRYYIQTTTTPTVGAYWPLEDAVGSTTLTGGISSTQPATFTGLTLANNTDLSGSSALPTFSATGMVYGTANTTFTDNQWQFDFHCFLPSDPGSSPIVMQINSTGTIIQWNIYFNTGGGVRIQGFNSSLATPVDSSFGLFGGTAIFGQFVHFSFSVQKSGSNTNWEFHAWPSLGGNQIAGGSSSYAGVPGNVSIWTVPAGSLLNNYSLGHVVVYDTFNYTQSGAPAFGWFGQETPRGRIGRLCTQIGIDYTESANGNSREIMGTQKIDSFMNIVRDTETTDQGILYDGANAGISWLTFNSRENASENHVSWNVDISQIQLSGIFDPYDDDQRNRNYYKVTRDSGTSAIWEDSTSTLGDGPNGIGRYESSLNINTSLDSDALNMAQWLVHVGTDPTYYRFPTIDFNFANTEASVNAANWLATDIGSRIKIVNINSLVTGFPSDTISMLVEGWTEFLSPFAWDVTVNCGPEQPWRVIELAADTGDTNEYLCHLDADVGDVTVHGNHAAGATTLNINTNVLGMGTTFTTNTDNYPMDLNISDWQVTASAIGAASSSAPVFVTKYTTAWSGSSPKSVTVTANAGDVLVIMASTSDSAWTLNTPNGGTGITYKLINSVVGIASSTNVYAWSASIPSNQTFSLSISSIAGGTYGFTVARFSNTGGIGASATAQVASGAPSVGLTTTRPDSAIICLSADWNGADGSTRVWRTINSITPTAGNGLELVYDFESTIVTTYVAYWNDVGAIATDTAGLTTPATQDYSIVAVEVLGTGIQALTVNALPAALADGTNITMWKPPALARGTRG